MIQVKFGIALEYSMVTVRDCDETRATQAIPHLTILSAELFPTSSTISGDWRQDWTCRTLEYAARLLACTYDRNRVLAAQFLARISLRLSSHCGSADGRHFPSPAAAQV